MVKFSATVRSVQEQVTVTGPYEKFIMLMLHARTITHIQHWQTASRSDHQALQFFYDSIVPLIDDFVESCQGEFGVVKNLPNEYFFPEGTPLEYVSNLCAEVDRLRVLPSFPQQSWIQNQVDEIRKVLSQTRYQLANLK